MTPAGRPQAMVVGSVAGETARLAAVLDKAGIQVEVQRGTRELEAALEHSAPDLVVVEAGTRAKATLDCLLRWTQGDAGRYAPVLLSLTPSAGASEHELLRQMLVECLPRPVPDELLVARVQAALERRKLIESGLARSEELRAMLEISKTVNSTLDSGAILYFIARKLGESMELQRCSFIVPDVELGIGRVIACKDDPNIHSLEINIDNYPEIRQVLRTGCRVVITDVEGDPIMAEVKRFADVFRDQSIMTLPLKLHEHIIGVLQVRKRSKERGFSDKELAYAELLANHAASALRNARLYEDRDRQNGELRRQKDELEALSRELKQKNDELVHLTQIKEDFTTMIVHDLRSPLMIVQGVLDLLNAKGKVEGAERDLIQDGINVTKKILRLINNLLEVSRLESGELSLREEDFDPGELVRESVEPLEVLAATRSIAIQTDIAPDLLPFRGDRGRLAQVLDNLVTNAINFTPEGGSVRVEARQETHGDVDHLRIDVVDSGIGVAPEDLPNIFKRFRQGRHSGTRKGTGLGLTIVELLVKAHSGAVTVESTPGKGSRFSVSLPMGVAKPLPAPTYQN